MPDTPDSSEPTVKELLDSATRADLERWFGLPSFEQLAEQGPAEPEEDPERAALRKRQADTIAAVDPALHEAILRRAEPDRPLFQPLPPISLHIDTEIVRIDVTRVEQQRVFAEPRELERPEAISDQLQERTPQALLRDLHRPELTFNKFFESTDVMAEQRVDIPAAITEALKPTEIPIVELSFLKIHEVMAALRADLRRPWAELSVLRRRDTERGTERGSE